MRTAARLIVIQGPMVINTCGIKSSLTLDKYRKDMEIVCLVSAKEIVRGYRGNPCFAMCCNVYAKSGSQGY